MIQEGCLQSSRRLGSRQSKGEAWQWTSFTIEKQRQLCNQVNVTGAQPSAMLSHYDIIPYKKYTRPRMHYLETKAPAVSKHSNARKWILVAQFVFF